MAKRSKSKFKPSRKAESDFLRALKKVAKHSGHIVDAHVTGGTLVDEKKLQKALNDYADLITPWARRISAKMLEQVQRQNKRAYRLKAKTLGRLLGGEKEMADMAYAIMVQQVDLIRSIPIEAGLRAQEIAFKAVMEGQRAQPDKGTIEALQKELGLSTEVATSRAELIARTETARATASINQARAQAAGSNQYRWHNSGDGAVRDSHKTYKGKPLQGRVFDWDSPPTLSDGMTGHPGTFPNCRCFAEPVFDGE